MILSDRVIKKLVREGALVVKPFREENLTPNGLDLTVGEEAVVMLESATPKPVRLVVNDSLVVPPHSHVLVLTEEYLELPSNVVAIVNLRSTYARRGLVIPPTVVDAGYKGKLTLAVRGGPHPVEVKRGERLWHLVFYESHEVEKPYEGRYQGSTRLEPGFETTRG